MTFFNLVLYGETEREKLSANMRFPRASRIIQALNDGCNLTLLGICSSFCDKQQLLQHPPKATFDPWKEPIRRLKGQRRKPRSLHWISAKSGSASQFRTLYRFQLAGSRRCLVQIGSTCFEQWLISCVGMTLKQW
jgi:hypothetical protein